MDLKSDYERDGMGHIFSVNGVLCGERLVSGSVLKYKPELLQKLRYQIGDLRGVERVDMTVNQMKEIAALDCQAARDAGVMKIALVASHELIFSLSSMYGAYAVEPCMEAKIFRNMSDARDWILGFIENGDLDVPASIPPTKVETDSTSSSSTSSLSR